MEKINNESKEGSGRTDVKSSGNNSNNNSKDGSGRTDVKSSGVNPNNNSKDGSGRTDVKSSGDNSNYNSKDGYLGDLNGLGLDQTENRPKRTNPFDVEHEIKNMRDIVNNIKYLESPPSDLNNKEQSKVSSRNENGSKTENGIKHNLVVPNPSNKSNSNLADDVKLTMDSSEVKITIEENKMSNDVGGGSISSLDGIIPSRQAAKRDRRQERINDALITAVYNSKPIEEVNKLLERGAQVLTRCRDSGASVLHVAALNADKEMLEFLVSKGADIQARDRLGRQAVHVAAWEGALAVLQSLCSADSEMVKYKVKLEEPYDIEHPDSWNHKHEQLNRVMEVINQGSTALHIACRRTKESCVKFLIDSGAKTLEEDDKGLYPVDVIGMNVNEDPSNRTSSDSSEGSLVGIAKLLISKQKRDSEDVKQDTPRGWLKLRRLFSVEEHDVRPVTALHTAVNDNNLNLIKILLDEGADVLIWDKDGQTPLHLAVKKKFEDALSLMLRHGDNKERKVVDAVDTNTRTLLHLAVEEEWTDGISLLLEENADITRKNINRETVLHIVASNGNIKILNELLTVPESNKIINAIDNNCYAPIHKSVESNHTKSMELLIIKGAKPDILLPDGRTLLHIVAKNNSLEMLQSLTNLSQIAKLKENKTSIGEGGMTALHIAASRGHSEMVEALINYGCDITATTSDLGSTAIHLAAKFDKLEVITTVLDYDKIGTTLEMKDNHGWYPLHIAAGHGHEDCVDTLLRSGSDIALTVQDEQGTLFTALDIIMTCVHRPVDFLTKILDSYIIVDDQIPVTNPQCKIEVDFDFLLPKCTDGKQLGVLEAVLNNGNEDLEEAIFLHPIVQTFIHLKSKNMFLFFALFFDLFFLLAFYLSVIAYHGSFTLREPVYRYILIGLLSTNMLVEIINVVRLQRYYLKDVETWIKWCVYLNVMFIVIHPSDLVLRYNMALSILLSWTELLLITAKYPAWGIYVLMFGTVASTILKVLAVFSLLLIGFAFTFRALFQEQGPFTSVWNSMVKVIIMVYEPDYRGSMDDMKDEGELFFIVARGLYLVFALMISMSLVNLMIGLAVSDIAELKRKGRAKRLAKQVAFLGGLENLLYSWPIDSLRWARTHRSAPPVLIVKAGSKLGGGSDSPVPRRLKEIIIDKARSVQQTNQQTEDTVSLLSRKISTLQSSLPPSRKISSLQSIQPTDSPIRKISSLQSKQLTFSNDEAGSVKRKVSSNNRLI